MRERRKKGAVLLSRVCGDVVCAARGLDQKPPGNERKRGRGVLPKKVSLLDDSENLGSAWKEHWKADVWARVCSVTLGLSSPCDRFQDKNLEDQPGAGRRVRAKLQGAVGSVKVPRRLVGSDEQVQLEQVRLPPTVNDKRKSRSIVREICCNLSSNRPGREVLDSKIRRDTTVGRAVLLLGVGVL